MTYPFSESSLYSLEWRHCGHGADSASSSLVGCRGIHVPGRTSCLAHLADDERAAYLATLSPGSDIDHRGTPFTSELLVELLDSLTDTSTGQPRPGAVRFDGVTFTDIADFGGVTFSGTARFGGATFSRDARFGEATFSGTADFGGATFTQDARFRGVTFTGTAWFGEARFTATADYGGAIFSRDAWFGGATFSRDAWFGGATFNRDAWFGGATFNRDAWFGGATFNRDGRFVEVSFAGTVDLGGATFSRNADFDRAILETASLFGPLKCGGTLNLAGAVFGAAVTIEAAAAAVVCRRTRWASTAALRLRHATVDLSDAVMEYPVSLATHTLPFTRGGGVEIAGMGSAESCVRLTSLRGMDAAYLVLSNVDLTTCRFAGTIHLDQLRMEGRCVLPTTPAGVSWHGMRPVRWTPRRTLAEEQHWRAARPSSGNGWMPAPVRERLVGPAELAPTYRQLRKALEDGKNEPGAADFYYGEMEMRRHDPDTPWAERALLAMYWAVSGYGLRASRAIGWLLVSMTIAVGAMMLWGLPQEAPKATTSGRQVEAGQNLRLVTNTPDPVNPTGPLIRRLTTDRFSVAMHVTVEAGMFRSPSKNLTTTGTWIEAILRFIEPVLLTLAVLAVRGRVKR